ncbi:hypothetical protein KAH94_05300 [bacterium]|nr:hypothetical protein [bacterium]
MKLTQLLFTLLTLSTFFSFSAKEKDYQYSNQFAQEIGRKAIDPFLPISFTPDGISYFLKQVYNRPDYGAEFLPNNFSHLLQFLDHGTKTNQGASYAQSVLKLFNNKLKSASYINAYIFSEMLTQLEPILKQYFVGPKPRKLETLKLSINDVLYSSFLSQFNFFKRDPKTFFNNLSHEILTSLNHELAGSKKEIEKEQLRQTTIRFLEVCINKLVWSPDDLLDVWQSVGTLSDNLAGMMKNNVIKDIDHLDDLFWSVTHRFCFFIDILGADLPVSFYQNIKQDLLAKKPLLCKLEEQEKLITSKTDHLLQAVITGEAKARAQQQGILTY